MSCGAYDRAGRNFFALISATGLANLADGVIRIGLPLLAARLTKDPFAVGGLIACFSAPWIVTSVHVGVLVDRLDRRRLLLAAHIARFVAMAALLLLFWAGGAILPYLYLLAFLLGTTEVVAMTCETAIVPMAVAPASVPRANAWITALETLGSESIGPAIGGLLFAVSTQAMFFAAAGWFLLAAVAAFSLRGEFRVKSQTSTDSILREARAGLAYLLGRRDLLYMTLLVGAVAACWSAWRTLIVLFAVAPGPMRLSPMEYGTLVAMLGAGGVAGALLAASITRAVGRKAAMFSNVIGTTAMLGAPLLATSPEVIGSAIFLAGMGSSVWSINSRTIVQQTVPTQMVGRFYSIYRLLSWGCLPLGAMLAGAAADSLGLQVAFACMAIVSALQAIPFWRGYNPPAPPD